MYSQVDVADFSLLFAGAKEFYGSTVVGELKDGKREAKCQTVFSLVSPAIIQRHLEGTESIGISPLKGDNTVGFGAIDIDDYQGDLMAIVKSIYKYNLPICPCYSKSRKLHLYFFFDIATPASDAVDVMKWYATAFRCNKSVEIFPKQSKRASTNKAYSWINLPYFDVNDEENCRKMVDVTGKLCGISEFLERAKDCRLSLAAHEERRQAIPCYDAPPCIISGVLLGSVTKGSRNTWLFSAAVYLKLKDENCDLEAQLAEINENLDDPLPEEELRSTILSSMQRKTYFYQCAQLADLCDKPRCTKLDYGVGSTKSTGLNFGDLTQVMSDPPTYEWEVNGQRMSFESEKQLLQQERFRELCLRMLHIVPRKVDDSRWSRIVTKACENIQIKYPETQLGDFSDGSIFLGIVYDFFNDKRKATDESQVQAYGRVYASESTRMYLYTANAFMEFLEGRGFKAFKKEEVSRRMRDMGSFPDNQGLWYMPFESIRDTKVPVKEIDLDLHEGESRDF